MKTVLAAMLAGVSLAVVASVALAGGKACESTKGGDGSTHVSVEQHQRLKDIHGWLYAEDAAGQAAGSSNRSMIHDPGAPRQRDR